MEELKYQFWNSEGAPNSCHHHYSSRRSEQKIDWQTDNPTHVKSIEQYARPLEKADFLSLSCYFRYFKLLILNTLLCIALQLRVSSTVPSSSKPLQRPLKRFTSEFLWYNRTFNWYIFNYFPTLTNSAGLVFLNLIVISPVIKNCFPRSNVKLTWYWRLHPLRSS